MVDIVKGRIPNIVTQRIIRTRIVNHGENAIRHVHLLECGHEVVRAPRKTYQRRAVCEQCGESV